MVGKSGETSQHEGHGIRRTELKKKGLGDKDGNDEGRLDEMKFFLDTANLNEIRERRLPRLS